MSALQFNLLPELKVKYIKAQKTKKIVATNALIVTGASFAIFLIMAATVYLVQKKQLSDADKEVERYSQQLGAIENLDEVLTVQNQLTSLSDLHRGKHIGSRLFTYLPQVTPSNTKIGNLSINFEEYKMQIDGTADSQHTVNTFADTLKFTKFKVAGSDEERDAFPSVVQSSFAITTTGVSYGLTVTFAPELFKNTSLQTPQLAVPQLTTTRSALGDPRNTLFNGQVGGQPAAGQRR